MKHTPIEKEPLEIRVKALESRICLLIKKLETKNTERDGNKQNSGTKVLSEGGNPEDLFIDLAQVEDEINALENGLKRA